MQFFPVSTSGSVSALGGVSLAVSSAAFAIHGEANAFLDSLNQKLAAAGVTPVVDPKESGGLPAGFRTVARDVSAKINKEDAESVIAALRKKGVQDSALAGLEELLASGQPVTLGAIAGVLLGRDGKGVELAENDMRELGGVLRNMQFSQEETDELIAMMQNGHGFAAMRAISGKLSSLASDDALSVTMNELRSLAKGLGLSEGAMEKIAALMHGRENAEVNARELESLLAPMTEELAAMRKEKEKLARELKDAINTALREKKIRESTDPVADNRGSRKTDRAETRMRDDLLYKSKNIITPDDEQTSLPSREENAAFTKQRDARERAAMTDPRQAGSEKTVSAKISGENSAPSSRGEDFSALASRLGASPGMTAPAPDASAVPRQSAAAYDRREIFSQVEQGLLKQLADGSRQMTLRLDPAELGQLTLLLTVKGGEVRAHIRTENAETTTLLSEQMSQIKAALEEQGLKVAQLDVETRLPNDTTRDNFSGMDMFHQEREMREQARFMRLAKLRRDSGERLAQDVQSTEHAEAISPSGLHIIA